MGSFKVLIVDDEDLLRGNIVSFLQAKGLDVKGVGSSQDALVAIKEFSPDVMLLDLKLEDNTETGIMVLQETKRIKPDTKVFIVSGMSADEFEEKVKGMGAEGFISKPISLKAINEIIEKRLG